MKKRYGVQCMLNKKNIFSKLESAVENNVRLLKDAESKGDIGYTKFYQKQQKALNQIVEYRDGLEWIKKADMKEKFTFCFKCGFDYEMITEHFGIGYETAKSLVFRLSNKFEEKIGSETLDLICDTSEDNVGVGIVAFYVNIGKFTKSNLFLSSIVDRLPEENCDKVFEMSECVNEIEFLYLYSRKGFETAFSNIDMEKLANVLYAIGKDTEKYKKERKTLVSLFREDTNMDLEKAEEELGIFHE